MTRRLNSAYGTPRETQVATRNILRSLFPPWLPGAFKVGRGGSWCGEFCCTSNCLLCKVVSCCPREPSSCRKLRGYRKVWIARCNGPG